MPKKKSAKKKTVTKKTAKRPAARTARAAPRKVAAPKKRAAKKVAKKSAGPRVHSVVHWEIQSQNPERLHSFYRDAFGWLIDANNPMNYGMVQSKGNEGINGGIGGSQMGGSRVTVYAAVPNIDSTLQRIAELGGQVIMPRQDIGPVIMGLYTDPEGNLMGLIEG
jgi:predicted enzyme related to lactoylglutathione lyase